MAVVLGCEFLSVLMLNMAYSEAASRIYTL